MANVIQVDDIIIARGVCFDTDQVGINQMHYVCNNTGSVPNTDQDFATALDTLLAPLYKLVINNIAFWRGVSVQIRRAGVLYAPAIENANAGAGTAGAIALPRQTCGLVGYSTGLAGVRFRGRMYIPFPSSTSDLGDGHPTGGYSLNIFNISQIYFGFNGPITPTGPTWLPALIHAPGKSPVPLPTLITGTYSSGNWATQRRRGSFGRQNAIPF